MERETIHIGATTYPVCGSMTQREEPCHETRNRPSNVISVPNCFCSLWFGGCGVCAGSARVSMTGSPGGGWKNFCYIVKTIYTKLYFFVKPGAMLGFNFIDPGHQLFI